MLPIHLKMVYNIMYDTSIVIYYCRAFTRTGLQWEVIQKVIYLIFLTSCYNFEGTIFGFPKKNSQNQDCRKYLARFYRSTLGKLPALDHLRSPKSVIAVTKNFWCLPSISVTR